MRWQLKLTLSTPDPVWHRDDTILEDSDSVLVLGKDSGEGFARLKRIASKLEQLGYYSLCQTHSRLTQNLTLCLKTRMATGRPMAINSFIMMVRMRGLEPPLPCEN